MLGIIPTSQLCYDIPLKSLDLGYRKTQSFSRRISFTPPLGWSCPLGCSLPPSLQSREGLIICSHPKAGDGAAGSHCTRWAQVQTNLLVLFPFTVLSLLTPPPNLFIFMHPHFFYHTPFYSFCDPCHQSFSFSFLTHFSVSWKVLFCSTCLSVHMY